ncbi:rhomboid family intramembrane serine protease [Capnocytophaga sp. oral taxon 338]|uniref:rhomboid family intramembrane serine protease n=1 Tax=Capnocytophaga sp. oral taxon 338 TaxID=710239 RepID=UPI000202CBFA|nr:rhomboid family intramembrane serine protease [Capnocytophaga sp. oral taxon 338]EGD33954.1 S54 family peptidase [Capnocytophaga sp. oral taxon 338 str. F0234]
MTTNILFFAILITTIGVSYYGFNNSNFFNRYMFNVGAVQRGDYLRLISSGFLHANWEHLIFNMISLYFFHGIIIHGMGSFIFLLIYLGSIVFGNLFSLYIYRHQSYYSAIGASGGVSGIIFAAIALFPYLQVNFIPGWFFGTLYFSYSVYMMLNPRQGDNLGHAAHLGGAIFGLVAIAFFEPMVIIQNALYLGIMALPLGYMGYKLLKK